MKSTSTYINTYKPAHTYTKVDGYFTASVIFSTVRVKWFLVKDGFLATVLYHAKGINVLLFMHVILTPCVIHSYEWQILFGPEPHVSIVTPFREAFFSRMSAD